MARATLLRDPDRAWLFALACALAAVLVALGVAGAVVLDTVWPVVAGAVLAVLLVVTGRRRPWRLELLYRGWNKLARGYASAATTTVSAILYFVVFPVAGLAGSAMRRHAPAHGASAWQERGTLTGEAFAAAGLTRAGRPASELAAWARGDRTWVVALLPYLGVLRALAASEESTVSSNTYTLY